ncbi:MAG: Hsp20/alpha crystallin family protein [Rhodospirillales bacterium]|nr:Hsp20/alpha crystallin family protein [Rhodospirillales bacterium]
MAQVPVEKKQSNVAPATDPFRALRNEMDRIFDRFTTGFGFPSFGRVFDMAPAWQSDWLLGDGLPAVDLTESDQAYKVAAELPGMTEKDVEVSVTDDILVIKGEKREDREEKTENRHVSERAYGSFRRSFSLPAGIDYDKMAASFANGVLTVTLPKAPEAQRKEKKIEVKAG